MGENNTPTALKDCGVKNQSESRLQSPNSENQTCKQPKTRRYWYRDCVNVLIEGLSAAVLTYASRAPKGITVMNTSPWLESY